MTLLRLPPLLAAMSAEYMFLAGILLMVIILMRRWRRYYGKRRRSSADSRPSRAATGTANKEPSRELPLLDAPAEFTRWHVEMHEVARDMKAELDSKISVLQSLVAMARQETARLESALAQSALDRHGQSE